MNSKTAIDDMVSELKQKHDELQVKISLAKMEAGDEWQKLEAKMAKLEAGAKELAEVTTDASEEIFAAAKLPGEEIRDGFKNIAKHF